MKSFRIDVEIAVRDGKGRLPPEMAEAVICKDMKWELKTLRAQPAWFVHHLMLLHSG
jgi:hypothetical protein